MAKAPFNDSFDAYTGTGYVTPGTYKFSAACRLVLSTAVRFVSPPLNQAAGYVNWTGSSLTAGGWAPLPNGIQWDIFLGDTLIFASDPGTVYQVWYTELVTPHYGSPYRRAWLFT